MEHRSILNEFGLAVFVVSASLVLKLGIATVALVGAVLLMRCLPPIRDRRHSSLGLIVCLVFYVR